MGGISPNGFVQISPNSAQSTGNVTNSLISLNENGINSPNLIDLQVSGVSRFLVDNQGRIGINNSSPSDKIHLSPSVGESGEMGVTITSGGMTSVNPRIMLDSGSSGASGIVSYDSNGFDLIFSEIRMLALQVT
ncbi:hypothetical protein D6810_01050 [Candidatus Dojkabacteria bacterium]|uniref:Uncharacterized protein n=1 Tax=Candidatus Dojkabacteria bacterium TaxID=2099670 RepID=A0A3M0Z375_9BACT|nr:MAG: hypothetical protein D6810_01050 [Candidatus Dojkabacteria bacterium]